MIALDSEAFITDLHIPGKLSWIFYVCYSDDVLQQSSLK